MEILIEKEYLYASSPILRIQFHLEAPIPGGPVHRFCQIIPILLVPADISDQ